MPQRKTTQAARMRKYRERMKQDQEQYEQYLDKERMRWKKRREMGKLKSVTDLSKREKRCQRRKWRESKKRSLKRKAEMLNVLSPPPSPAVEAPVSPAVPDGGNKQRGRKTVRRKKAAAYRTIEKLKEDLAKEKRRAERYKKQLQRRNCSSKLESGNMLTPKSKTARMLKGSNVSSNVRKTLLFHNTLLAELKQKNESRRKLVRDMVSGKLISKYRFKNRLAQTACVTKRKAQSRPTCINQVVHAVSQFLQRDENSRLAAGKKDCITRHKIKKQKRFLCYPLVQLHRKFLKETPSKISYSLFCRLRPFWVIPPRHTDRDTCRCTTHEHIKMKIDKLKQLQVIASSDLTTLIGQITCDQDNKDCMYRECSTCREKKLPTSDFDRYTRTFYWEWRQKRESYEKQENETTVTAYYKITSKEKVETTLGDFLEYFQKDLDRVCAHIYNIKHQFTQFRKMKETLSKTSVAVHIDFAENFNCGYTSEVQSAHFGGSHRQASLHTGVAYIEGETLPFCTISSSTRHDPSAIWAHLEPILSEMNTRNPQLDTIHFISDGPTTQYRNRKNMYYFSTRLFDRGFVRATWNFSEAGHGKGAPDGVGGALKRAASSLIAHGTDIPDAETLYHELKKNTSVLLYYVTGQNIQEVEKSLPDDIRAVKGIMKIHQCIAFNEEPGVVKTRILSCFCKADFDCDCYSSKNNPIVAARSECDHIENEKLGPDGKEIKEGAFCTFVYDCIMYAGLVKTIDGDEAEISSLRGVGNNRFVWPQTEDRIWYKQADILQVIPPPEPVTKRLLQLDNATWQKLHDANQSN